MKTPYSLDTEPVSRGIGSARRLFRLRTRPDETLCVNLLLAGFPNLHRRAHPTGSRTLRRMLASQGFVELEQA